MKKIPLILQQDAMDCGPSCLAMICSYYGQQISCKQLRKICSLGKAGVSILGISKAAVVIGLKTYAQPELKEIGFIEGGSN